MQRSMGMTAETINMGNMADLDIHLETVKVVQAKNIQVTLKLTLFLIEQEHDVPKPFPE